MNADVELVFVLPPKADPPPEVYAPNPPLVGALACVVCPNADVPLPVDCNADPKVEEPLDANVLKPPAEDAEVAAGGTGFGKLGWPNADCPKAG